MRGNPDPAAYQYNQKGLINQCHLLCKMLKAALN